MEGEFEGRVCGKRDLGWRKLKERKGEEKKIVIWMEVTEKCELGL